jgi:hypothetical protein
MSEEKFLEKLVAAIDRLDKLLADEYRQHHDEVVRLRAEIAALRAENSTLRQSLSVERQMN